MMQTTRNETNKSLIRAIRNKDAKRVQILLGEGADVSGLPHAPPPLMVAVDVDSLEIVRILLDKKANPDLGFKGETPLMASASHGNVPILKELLKAHANKDHQNREQFGYGRSALMLAVMYRNTHCVRELLRHKADIHAKDVDGNTALHLSVGSPVFITHVGPLIPVSDIVALLMRNGADPRIKNKKGESALGIAASKGDDTLLSLLRLRDRRQ